MISYYADINVNGDIINGLRLRGVDVLRGQDDGYDGRPDPEVLERATELSRVLYSHNDDMLREAKSMQQSGAPFSGVCYSHQKNSPVGKCVDDLEYLAKAGTPEDFANQVYYLPF